MPGKTVWSILLVGACLTACASQEPALVKNLLDGGVPLFSQPVEPILGTILEIRIASPITDAPGARHRQAAALIASTKTALKKFGAFLPKHPIRSGDAIVTIDRSMFGDLLGGRKADVKLNKDLEYITQGWSRFQGKKVLVAAIDESVNVSLARDGDLRVKVDGFYLFDAKTFQIVKGEVLWVIAPILPGKDRYRSKIRIHQSSRGADTLH